MRTDDLLSLAYKLSPHSARLRAFLGVLAWNVQRTRMPGDAFSRLPQLVEEVMAEIGVNELGEFAEYLRPDLPEPDGFRSAVRWMRHSVFLKSAAYQARKWCAERGGGDPGLLAWIDAVVRKFEVLGVPVWPRTIVVSEADQNRLFVLGVSHHRFGQSPHNHGYAVELVHGLFGRDLPPECWWAFSNVGFSVAKALDLEIEWGGDLHAWSGATQPWLWLIAGPGVGERPFVEPSNWSRSPPGERERLLKHYGIT